MRLLITFILVSMGAFQCASNVQAQSAGKSSPRVSAKVKSLKALEAARVEQELAKAAAIERLRERRALEKLRLEAELLKEIEAGDNEPLERPNTDQATVGEAL